VLEPAVDLVVEDGLAPAVLEDLAGVPEAFGRILELLDQQVL
jgi:hypothetical protein